MDGSQLADLYKIRFPEQKLERKNAIWKIICSSFIQKFIDPNSTVIDIACGYGEFLNNISTKRKIAVDMNPDAKSFLSSDIEFRLCSALEIDLDLIDTADVVFTSNFLEHLPDKGALDLFLQQVFLLLRPGGSYIILGPNLRYLPGQYWDFYDHHLGLTHLSLIEALQMQGFKPKICIDRFLPFTTQTSLPTHPLFVWLYLKLPFAWKVFGKQFFIVANKPL
jgi:SAM-dependent methyltransferase